MSLKKILTLTIIFATVSALMVSCNLGSYPGFKKSKSGVYYKIHKDNSEDTTAIRLGSIVTMYLKYGTEDSTMFDSKDIPQPVVIPVLESTYEGDFYEMLTMLKQGDSATFILKAGPLFNQTFQQPALPEFLTEESDIYFDMMIKKVQTEEQVEIEKQVKNMQLEQEEMINLEEYVKNNEISVQPNSSGVYYIETKKGKGKSPVIDGYCATHFTVYLLGGDQLFSTLDREEPIEFKFGSQFENEGFQEVIGMMKEGGKANAIVPSTMAFGAEGAGTIVPPFSTLYYEIDLIDVMTSQEYDKKQAKKEAEREAKNIILEKEETSNIQKYLKDNNITPTTTLPNGLMYVEVEAGSGAKPVQGKKVKVHYTGKLLDGTIFDSSLDKGQPFEFTLGTGAVIEGWDQGIALMNEGGKAMLIIPSKLAYKDRGAGDRIPPFSPLTFDVELIETEK